MVEHGNRPGSQRGKGGPLAGGVSLSLRRLGLGRTVTVTLRRRPGRRRRRRKFSC